ncbi:MULTISPECIES: hypothetical protein [Pontibacter]|uniref:Uncharacterized protein n=1 Tax=Pontibacter lucknowensis TaxID=1077936 RepID=A0A1N6XD37_9BACT|nr:MULTISPECIES: hypothetical protein [Pontibacter]SIR00274.1 hypothetical protein SAMN05421545_2074 [Pontibacter lucknowensis]
MKKILYAGFGLMFGMMGLVACDNSGTGTTETDGTVIHKDSVASEYEVTETVVERDTTTNTRTVDVDRENNPDNR